VCTHVSDNVNKKELGGMSYSLPLKRRISSWEVQVNVLGERPLRLDLYSAEAKEGLRLGVDAG